MRVHKLPFIPEAKPFSTYAPEYIDSIGSDENEPELDKEIILVKALSTLSSDKERCVLLLEILREYGYQLDYGSIATSLNIKLRWFMRCKAAVRQKVQKIAVNTL